MAALVFGMLSNRHIKEKYKTTRRRPATWWDSSVRVGSVIIPAPFPQSLLSRLWLLEDIKCILPQDNEMHV